MFDYACLQSDGGDLRFIDEGGAVLAHEIDEWRPEEGALVWVRVSSLEPTGTSLWLYYGNPAGAAEPAEVWPQTLGYQAVLHFGGDLDDALGLHHGEPPGMEPTFVEGLLGRAVHYETILVESRAELAGSEEIDAAIATSESLTVTAWIRATPDVAAPTPFRSVVTRGSALWSMSVYDTTLDEYDFYPPAYVLFNSDCVELECEDLVDAFDNHFLVGTVPVIEHPILAAWHHIAIVYEPVGGDFSKRIYIDGVLDVEFAGPLPLPGDSLELAPITIGAGTTTPDQFAFHGEIDEVRIANQAWGAERINADQAFADQADLVMLGTAECNRP